MTDTKVLQFLDLTGLQAYDAKSKQRVDVAIANAVATSLKGVALSEEGKLLFYTDYPIDGATPSCEIELPETDLSGLLPKFEAATAGHVVTVAEDGKTIVDSGKTLDDYATKAELATTTATADEAKAKGEALAEVMGVIPETSDAKTLVEYIQELTSGIATDAALAELQADIDKAQEDITALQGAVNTLNGDNSVEGSVEYKIVQELAKILNDHDETDIDTLEEIAAWIKNDTAGVGDLNLRITNNTTAIDSLRAYVGTLPEGAKATTVVEYIAEALESADLSKYALASDLADALTRITANEQAIAVVNAALAEGGTTYNSIVEAKKAGTDAQAAVDSLSAYVGIFTPVSDETTIVAYIDAKCQKVTADIEARLKAVEDRVTETESRLNAIENEETGILKQAKDYTDELANGAVATNTANIASVQATVDSISAIPTSEIDAMFAEE